MNKRRDLHEWRYEHSCHLVQERDVLETDIKGNSYGARMRRWWHGLFLQSYHSTEDKSMYSSPHTIMNERQRHFRNHRGRIHPLSKFRKFWNFFIFFVVMADDVCCHHNLSLLFGKTLRNLYYIAAVLDVIVIVDMFLNLTSGYVNKQTRKAVLDKRSIILHYCSTKLFLHAASAIPHRWLLFLRFGNEFDCILCKTIRFTAVLKTLRIFNIFRIYECSSCFLKKGGNIKVNYTLMVVRICILGFFTLFQLKELDYIISLRIMVEKGKLEVSSVCMMIQTKIEGPEYLRDNAFLLGMISFSHIFRSVFLVNYFYQAHMYYLDRIFRLLTLICASVFIAWMTAVCFALVAELKFPEDRLMKIQQSLRSMALERRLPDRVTAKVGRYLEYSFTNLKIVENRSHMYKNLLESLKREITVESYLWFVEKIPYFRDWPMAVKQSLVHLLNEKIFMQNDLVAEPDVPGEGVCIVAAGELAEFHGAEETGHLIDGDFFDERSLAGEWMRVSRFVAITPCLILVLPTTKLEEFMRDHPDLFTKMKEQLTRSSKPILLSPLIKDKGSVTL